MANRPPRTLRPLDAGAIDRLALHYVARYATTRAKLLQYLERKIRDRGWVGEEPADPAAVADRMVALRYIDDAAFAQGRADALLRRGYGERRVVVALRAAGVGGEERDRNPELEWAAALAFARRRRFGPYAAERADVVATRRATAAMLRAGHDPAVVRRIISALPGEVPEAAY